MGLRGKVQRFKEDWAAAGKALEEADAREKRKAAKAKPKQGEDFVPPVIDVSGVVQQHHHHG